MFDPAIQRCQKNQRKNREIEAIFDPFKKKLLRVKQIKFSEGPMFDSI